MFQDVDLVVFDMAGTTIDEGGTVYQVLQDTLTAFHIPFTDDAFQACHGLRKRQVIDLFLRDSTCAVHVDVVVDAFYTALSDAYASSPTLRVMDGALTLFQGLRQRGIKVCLNTGYNRAIADALVERLRLAPHIDAYTTSSHVPRGRPHPDMIHLLMARFGLTRPDRVVKVGDTVADILEGQRAQTRAQIAVLSGADSRDVLATHGPTCIVESVQDLIPLLHPLGPGAANGRTATRRPCICTATPCRTPHTPPPRGS